MIALFALLTGCTTLPSSIPDQAGTITEANVAEIMTVAVPDAPYMLWLAMYTMAGEQQFRTCPEIFISDTTTSFSASNCVDSAGITWNGSATLRADGTTYYLSFNDFGMDGGGIAGSWSLKGSIYVKSTADYRGNDFTTKLAIVAKASGTNATDLEYWIDTQSSYTEVDSDYTYADNWTGQVGVGGNGLFDVLGARTEVSIVNGCNFGAAGFGKIALQGVERADFSFHEDASQEPAAGPTAPPPYPTDTGFPTDTGDTADTADTGDTAETDTADSADTGATEEQDLLCGCADTTLTSADGQAGTISTCMIPSRQIAWPFVPIY